MTRLLNRIWVRFGLWFAATTLCSIALMVGVMLAFDVNPAGRVHVGHIRKPRSVSTS